MAWFVDLLHLSPRCLVQSVEPGSLPEAHTRYKGRSDNSGEVRQITSAGVGKQASRMSKSLRCLGIEISIPTSCGGGDQVQLESWVMGWSPGERDHAWLWRVLALAYIHAPSSARSCLPARRHHATIQHERCHQVHWLHLGLTQCPEPKKHYTSFIYKSHCL